MITIPKKGKKTSYKTIHNLFFFSFFIKRATRVIFVFLWRKKAFQEGSYCWFYTRPALIFLMDILYFYIFFQLLCKERTNKCLYNIPFINKHIMDVGVIRQVCYWSWITDHVSLCCHGAPRSSACYYHHQPQLVIC